MKRAHPLVGPALIVGLLVLIAAHLFAIGVLGARLAFPAAAVAGVVAVAGLAHLGALGPVGAWLRRRLHRDPN